MKPRWLFLFFLVSGFCSLVDEVVWLRLAMASFGVTTPIVAMVLSIFMGGLAIGSFAAGRLKPRAPLRLYALAELAIGSSALFVPLGLHLGRAMLSGAGGGIGWGSAAHHAASGAWIAVVLLPFTAAMGATFPLAMASLRSTDAAESSRSFSYLYLANVLGATAGTAASALFLIELLGFRRTLYAAAALNVLLAAGAYVFSRSATGRAPARPAGKASRTPAGSGMLALLFLTGLTSMALEVVWIRQLTPFLGTVVYAFAMILVVYLLATSLGSAVYRRWIGDDFRAGWVWLGAGCAALLALVAADPRLGATGFGWISFARVLLSVVPFAAAVGILTPLLVDRWSAGAPERAGVAYAVNVVGCILGPLLSSFVLLPSIGERWATAALAVPLLVVGAARKSRRLAVAGAATLVLVLVFGTRDFETIYPHRVVRRDSTATVIAAGDGMQKQLLVNGFGMTILSRITKGIAHLPMAFLPERPKNVLVICFGMGTSFRSAVSWGVPTTSVELIPSVPEVFGYFHADAASVVSKPGARIVIDDGRRFLERTAETFDVITIDPPPPIEAAGSSLLYSREFYGAVRSRLRPGGIVQQWLSGSDPRIVPSIARPLVETFRYVRAFGSVERCKIHFLASDSPIPPVTAETLAARMPGPAMADFAEWEPRYSARDLFTSILRLEIPIDSLLGSAPPITDDRPVNEYFLVRWMLGPRSPRP